MTFDEALKSTQGLTLLDEDRLRVIWACVLQTNSVPGICVECGSYKGGSGLLIAAASTKRVHLFDTFTGLPAADPDRDLYKGGEFSDVLVESVYDLVGEEVDIHQGRIERTLHKAIEGRKISFAHLDLDLYAPTKFALEQIFPLLAAGSIIVIDDYRGAYEPGVTQAVDEFFADKVEFPIPTGPIQAIVVRM